MDELVAVHPFGAPGNMTCSPDGKYIYAAEGGTVSLILADVNHPNVTTNYETPVWRLPVGKQGALPIELLLDPAMDWLPPVNAADPNAFLYLAAGRDGLWIMDASPVDLSSTSGSSSRLAYRVDDSGNNDETTQFSRRWCNDVKTVELEGRTYLLALFAGRGRSKLRIYDIVDVRGVAGGLETGNEIPPLAEASLGSNFNVTAAGGNTNAQSYAFGMAIDTVSEFQANVYVAMGEHGIFRVPLNSVGSSLQPLSVQHGPWFGDGSAYETPSSQNLYGSLEYYLPVGSTNPADLVARYNPYFLDLAVQNNGPGEHRLYAAVDNLGWCTFSLEPGVNWDEYIYTANGLDGYPDFYQEGQPYQIASQPNYEIHLYDDSSAMPPVTPSHARHIEVVTTVDDQAQEFSSLVVSMSPKRFSVDPGHMNEGRVLDAALDLGPFPTSAISSASTGSEEFVLAYDLRNVGDANSTPAWIHGGQNVRGVIHGGWELSVPPEPADGELHVIYGAWVGDDRLYEPAGATVGKQELTRAWFSPWPPTAPGVVSHTGYQTRGRHFRLGRLAINVGPSKLNPRVLVTSSNDGGVIPDGPLIFDPVQGTIEAPFASPGWAYENPPQISVRDGVTIPGGQNEELTYGTTMDPRGGFVGTHNNQDYEYRMGVHPRNIKILPLEEKYPERWRCERFSVTGTTTVTAVTVSKELWFTGPANKFSIAPYENQSLNDRVSWSGRAFYNVISTFEDYNTHVATHYATTVDAEGLMFAGMNGSPQGVWVVGMTPLQTAMDAPNSPGNQDLLIPSDYSGPLGNAPGLLLGALVTHPEYWNIDDTRMGIGVADPHANYFIQKADHSTASVQTWYPDLFSMPVDGTPGADIGWLLAVPCGYISMSETDTAFQNHPMWIPDQEFRDGHLHMMVRLFDLTDPTLLKLVDESNAASTNLDSENLPAVTIIGPDPDTSAYLVHGISVEDTLGVQRHLLIVGDLSGRVYVYDVADVFQTMAAIAGEKHYGAFFSDAPLLTYETQRSLSDDSTNGVYGLEYSQESWAVGQTQHEATYVYVGTPRVGVEVLELGFNAANVAELNYIGRIQTPGNASHLYIDEVAGTNHLFVADYDSGIRIYKLPAGGQ